MTLRTHLKSLVSFFIGIWIRAIISLVSTVSTPIILIVPEELGRAAMYTLVYNMALQISKLGLDESYLRHYHEKRDKSVFFLTHSCQR